MVTSTYLEGVVEPNPVSDFVSEVLAIVEEVMATVDEEIVAHDDSIILLGCVGKIPGEV